jgi:hypothetical protein
MGFMDKRILPAISLALLASACNAKPFGSDLTSLSTDGRMYEDVLVERSRSGDVDGKPTYSIFGPFAPGESPEIKGERIMRLACSTGDPKLVQADAISGAMAGRGDNRPWMGAEFTCNNVIW